MAAKGFSPSSLSQYIRNPIDFYNQKILGVKAENLLEETIAANTFGSIIHNTLEAFYTPLLGMCVGCGNDHCFKTQNRSHSDSLF